MRERNFPPAAPQTWFVAERKILILSLSKDAQR
jgi:hypothetical protein